MNENESLRSNVNLAVLSELWEIFYHGTGNKFTLFPLNISDITLIQTHWCCSDSILIQKGVNICGNKSIKMGSHTRDILQFKISCLIQHSLPRVLIACKYRISKYRIIYLLISQAYPWLFITILVSITQFFYWYITNI